MPLAASLRWSKLKEPCGRGVKTSDGPHLHRLDCYWHLPAAEFADLSVLSAPLFGKHRGILRFRAIRCVVAGGNIHGGDDVRRGYAAAGRWAGSQKRNFRKLAVVVAMSLRDDDGFLLRALLARIGNSDRRRICRAALRREARRLFARISRAVSRRADELL